jgi:hypothetical protein
MPANEPQTQATRTRPRGASIYLARLLGPLMVVAGIGMLTNGALFRPIAEEFLRSLALIYLTGLIAMVGGTAIVLAHNVWAWHWSVIITIIGWLAVIGGIVRIVAPQTVASIGMGMIGKPALVPVYGVVTIVLGAILCCLSCRKEPAQTPAKGAQQ